MSSRAPTTKPKKARTKAYPLDFRAQAVIRAKAGESLRDLGEELDVHFALISKWTRNKKVLARVAEITDPAYEGDRSGVTTPAGAAQAVKEAADESVALAMAPALPPPAPEWLAEQGFSPATFADFVQMVRVYGLPDLAMEVFGLDRGAWLSWQDWATTGAGHVDAARACARVLQARAIFLLNNFIRLAAGGRGWQGAKDALGYADQARFGSKKDDEAGRLAVESAVLRQILRVAGANDADDAAEVA